MPDLLRRLADSIAELGDIEIQDVVFHAELDEAGKRWPSMTVYFHTEGHDEN